MDEYEAAVSGQFKAAAIGAWLVVSAVVMLVLAAPLVLPGRTIDALAPVCEWKVKHGRECPLCGMTTSFLLISNGQFRQAAGRNHASIPLYSALVGNEFAAAWFMLRRRARKFRGGAGRSQAE